MKNIETINIEKALSEKREMQKKFISEHGYPSSVLTLVITHFEEREKNK